MLPAYAARTEGDASSAVLENSVDDSTSIPPSYEPGIQLAPTYKVHKSFTTPVISIAQVLAHLKILQAFETLRKRVLDAPSDIDADMLPDVKWALFLTRASWRFDTWVRTVVNRNNRRRGEVSLLLAIEIPPLDVLMCWHSYLLSPSNYYLDCEATHPFLRKVGPFPLEAIAFLINSQTFEYDPDLAQVEEWELQTLLQFDPPITTTPHDTEDIFCPQCGTTNVVPWLCPTEERHMDGEHYFEGKGLSQAGFSKKCIACDLLITREAFCASRAARDITRASQTIAKGEPAFLSHVLLGTRGKPSPEIANRFTTMLVYGLESPEIISAPDARVAYAQLFEWNLTSALHVIERGIKRQTPLKAWHGDFIRRAMKSWRHALPFSLDIPAAVMRQFKFTHDVISLSWTSPTYLTQNPELIPSFIADYHKFLDLSSQVFKPLVPTLGIDLCWHTHMLLGDQYRLDTERLVGRFVDHDDKVEEGTLAAAFVETAQTWKSRFKTPYLSPSSPTSPLSFSSLKSKATLTSINVSSFWRKRSNSKVSTTSVIGVPVPEPLIPPTESHPPSSTTMNAYTEPPLEISTHNSVLVLEGSNLSIETRRQRQQKLDRFSSSASSPSVSSSNTTTRPSPGPLTPTAPTDLVAFTRPMPEGGSSAAGFSSLGKAGWDIFGKLRDVHVLDGKENRGDCCTGNYISCSSTTWLSIHRPVDQRDGNSMFSAMPATF